MSEQRQSLPEHPEHRLDEPPIQVDVEKVADKLLGEPLPGNRGHRQQVLYRRDRLTIALFLFEQGASLPQHLARGVVSVHVLRGRLNMTAEGQTYDLPAGSMLVLPLGTQHDVRAMEPTRMLLTVSLDDTASKHEAKP